MKLFKIILLFCLLAQFACFSQSSQQIRDHKLRQTIVTTSDFRNNKTVVKKIMTRYDKKGRSIETKEFDTDGKLISWEKNVYDKKGNELFQIQLDKDSTELSKNERGFDKWNNEIQEIKSEKGVVKEISKSYFNPQGNKTAELVFDGAQQLLRKLVFEYDATGLLTKRTTINAAGKITYSKEYNYSR